MENSSEEGTCLFRQMLAEAGWDLRRLQWRVQDLFGPLDPRGKSFLEIGCGRGDFLIYFALHGAESVVGIDPAGRGGDGSSRNILTTRLAKFRPKNLSFRPIAFDELDSEAETYDVIYGISVIEHIHETRLPLYSDQESRAKYLRFFKRCYELLKPDGMLVITDYARDGLWAGLWRLTGHRIKSPISPGINWDIHQQSETWQELMRKAGFGRSDSAWFVPYRFRRFPSLARFYPIAQIYGPRYTIRAYRDTNT